MRKGRRSSNRLVVLLSGLILAHRLLLWGLFGSRIDAVAIANPNWFTWQYLLRGAYVDHLGTALWYLQQTPPLPHLVLGLIAKVADWPVPVARCLYALQAFITAGTASLLFLVLLRLRCGLIVGFGAALYFGLSIDVYVMELSSLGQLFYENGAMLFAAWTCYALISALHCQRDGRPASWHCVGAGTLVAVCALTRASFSLMFAPVLAFTAVFLGPRRCLFVLIPVLLLQGGWSLKNDIVYGYLSPNLSSWAGINATVRMDERGKDAFARLIATGGTGNAPWIVNMMREKGYQAWSSTVLHDYLPEDVVARQDEIQSEMDGNNRPENSVGIQMLSSEYLKALRPFVLAHPALFWRRFLDAYSVFWQPIADYGALFMSPITTLPQHRVLFRRWRVTPTAQARISAGIHPNMTVTDIAVPAVSLAPIDALSFWCLHLLVPLLLLVDATRLALARPPFTSPEMLLLAAVVAYGGVLFNAVELSENMRFRLSVEPEIIALSMASLSAGHSALRAAVGALGYRDGRDVASWIPRRTGDLGPVRSRRRRASPAAAGDDSMRQPVPHFAAIWRAGNFIAMYVAFALIATALNLTVQQLVMVALSGSTSYALPLSVLSGTAVGFTSKYLLDKHLVFFDKSHNRMDEIRKIALYGGFALFTTAIFWGAELGAFYLFGTVQAKFTGAVLGLTIGYTTKYLLDRRYTFRRIATGETGA